MDKATYDRWWPLHMRAVEKEPLTAEEREVYEAGLKQLHAEEKLHFDVDALRRAREAVMAKRAQLERLQERRKQLEAKIALLEAALSPETRQAIGVKD